jgi:hypothetical protein
VKLINPILRGWVNYFAVRHSSECFSFIQDWVEKKVRRQALSPIPKGTSLITSEAPYLEDVVKANTVRHAWSGIHDDDLQLHTEKWHQITSSKKSETAVGIARGPAVVDPHITADSPCSPCANAAMRADASGSSAASAIRAPMRRIRSACCARAASGHAAAAPPRSVMNSRRFN